MTTAKEGKTISAESKGWHHPSSTQQLWCHFPSSIHLLLDFSTVGFRMGFETRVPLLGSFKLNTERTPFQNSCQRFLLNHNTNQQVQEEPGKTCKIQNLTCFVENASTSLILYIIIKNMRKNNVWINSLKQIKQTFWRQRSPAKYQTPISLWSAQQDHLWGKQEMGLLNKIINFIFQSHPKKDHVWPFPHFL